MARLLLKASNPCIRIITYSRSAHVMRPRSAAPWRRGGLQAIEASNRTAKRLTNRHVATMTLPPIYIPDLSHTPTPSILVKGAGEVPVFRKTGCTTRLIAGGKSTWPRKLRIQGPGCAATKVWLYSWHKTDRTLALVIN